MWSDYAGDTAGASVYRLPGGRDVGDGDFINTGRADLTNGYRSVTRTNGLRARGQVQFVTAPVSTTAAAAAV